MKVVKVIVDKAVLANFFIQGVDRALVVTKGLPKGTELIFFEYNKAQGNFVGLFGHESFADIPEGDKIPAVEIEYTVLGIVKKEAPVPVPEPEAEPSLIIH